MPKMILPLDAGALERFWRFVDTSGGPDACWPWTGSRDKEKHDYGNFRKRKPRSTLRAHRVAYAISTGEEPGDMMVCHSCDNPPCCNAKHLFLGTAQDNSTDMVQKGRAAKNDCKGVKNGYAKLSEADVAQVMSLIAQGHNNTVIGQWFGVHHATISLIRRGKVWGIGGPLTKKYSSLINI